MKKVYVIESIPNADRKFRLALKGLCQVQFCTDIRAALDEIYQFQPDLLVVDLSMPGVRSGNLLQHICYLGMNVSILASDIIYQDQCLYPIMNNTRFTKVDLLLRPFELKYLIERTVSIVYELEAMDAERRANLNIREIAKNILVSFGFHVHLQGFQYTIDAVVYAAEHRDSALSYEVYPYVAKKYGVTGTAIERGIRSTVEKARLNGPDRIWNLYFPSEKQIHTKKIHNNEFIERMILMIENEINMYQPAE